MSALWWLLPLALAACLAVLAVAARLSPKPRHAAPRRHLAAVPEPPPDPPYPLPWPRLEGDWLPAPPHGSMILAEERAVSLPRTGQAFGAGPMWEYRAPDWREQTAADLAPEALNDQPDPYLDAIAAEHGSEYDLPFTWTDEVRKTIDPSQPAPEPHLPDSGPGAPSSGSDTPGPVWLDGQLAVLYEWVRAQYAAAAA